MRRSGSLRRGLRRDSRTQVQVVVTARCVCWSPRLPSTAFNRPCQNDKKTTNLGLEPKVFSSGGRCDIHYASRSFNSKSYYRAGLEHIKNNTCQFTNNGQERTSARLSTVRRRRRRGGHFESSPHGPPIRALGSSLSVTRLGSSLSGACLWPRRPRRQRTILDAATRSHGHRRSLRLSRLHGPATDAADGTR